VSLFGRLDGLCASPTYPTVSPTPYAHSKYTCCSFTVHSSCLLLVRSKHKWKPSLKDGAIAIVVASLKNTVKTGWRFRGVVALDAVPLI